LQGDQKKMQGSVSRYAAGAITEELRGINAALTTGLKTVRTVDAVTHNLLTQQTGPGSTPTTVQNLAYRWDAVGNLTERQDVRAALTETFSYDNLHRLDTAALNGTTNLDMTYNSLGNITNRSDVGAYTYDATKIHALKTLDGGSAFAYDGNGSATTVPEVGTMSWFTTGLLKSVSDGGSFSSTFAYTPQGQRYAQTASFQGGTQSTQYLGGILEKVTEGTLTQWKHYIQGPTSTVALYIRNSTGTPSTQLFTLTQDHLGSIDTILKDTGAIEVRLAYDAYGDRRNPTTGSGEPTQSEWDKIYATTHRGYTEHEHLDDFQMLHMNGRILDSLSGRVLSADPFIPNPRSTQDYNRYSYVNNNPLRYIDPSGFCETEYDTDLETGEVIETIVVCGSPWDDPFWDDEWILDNDDGFFDDDYGLEALTESSAAADSSTNAVQEEQSQTPICAGAPPQLIDANITAAVATARALAASDIGDSTPPIGARGLDSVTSARIAPYQQIAANIDWPRVAKAGARLGSAFNVYNVVSGFQSSVTDGLYASVDVAVGTALAFVPFAGVPLSIAYSAHGGSKALVNDARYVTGQCRAP
jgi:RHS repeat-associated protein